MQIAVSEDEIKRLYWLFSKGFIDSLLPHFSLAAVVRQVETGRVFTGRAETRGFMEERRSSFTNPRVANVRV